MNYGNNIVETRGYQDSTRTWEDKGSVIELCCLDTIMNACPVIEDVVPHRQVPSDNFPVANNDDGAPSYPQAINLCACINDQPRNTRLEVKNCGHIIIQLCSHYQ